MITQGEWLIVNHGQVTKEEYMRDCEMKWDGTVKHGDTGLDFMEIAAKDEVESDIVTIALCGNGPNAQEHVALIAAAPDLLEALRSAIGILKLLGCPDCDGSGIISVDGGENGLDLEPCRICSEIEIMNQATAKAEKTS